MPSRAESHSVLPMKDSCSVIAPAGESGIGSLLRQLSAKLYARRADLVTGASTTVEVSPSRTTPLS